MSYADECIRMLALRDQLVQHRKDMSGATAARGMIRPAIRTHALAARAAGR